MNFQAKNTPILFRSLNDRKYKAFSNSFHLHFSLKHPIKFIDVEKKKDIKNHLNVICCEEFNRKTFFKYPIAYKSIKLFDFHSIIFLAGFLLDVKKKKRLSVEYNFPGFFFTLQKTFLDHHGLGF